VPLDRVRTVFTTVAGAPYYSNLYFLNPTGANQAASVIAQVKAFWTTMSPTMFNTIPWNVEADVPVINEIDGKITSIHTGVAQSGTGTNVGEVLPPSTQLLARLQTGGFVNGRRVRGRIFIPLQVESNSTNGRPTASLLTTLNGALTTLIGSAIQLNIWSRPYTDPLGVKPSRPGSTFGVTSGSGWSEWAVMRSRRD